MRDWAADLYLFLARHRLILVLAMGIILGLSFWRAFDMELDMSLKALLPDSSASLRQSADLFDLAPFSRVMLVQLTSETPDEAHRLAQTADGWLNGLDPELLKPLNLADNLPDPAGMMALLPALCDQVCLARLEDSADPAGLSAALADLKNKLAGPAGINTFFWRADPLNWRDEVFRHFPTASGWPVIDPMLGYPVTPDGRHLLMMFKPAMSMNDTVGAKKLMDNIETLTRSLPAGLSAQVVGAHRHTAANASAIEGDLALTMTLAMVLILAIYLFLVRSLGAVWLFLTPAVAVLAAATGLSLVFPLVSGLALGFGAAVLGIAEDYAVHVHYALRRAPQKTVALSHAARPLLMSTILCVAGFGVLLFSAIPAIRQLAFFSAAAIAFGYVWAIVVLPHCPAMDRPREDSAREKKGRPAGRPAGVYVALLFLSGVTLFLATLVPVNTSVRILGFTSPELLRDQQSLEENWKLEGSRRVYLVPGQNQAEALALAGQVAAELNSAVPGSASSLAGLIPDEETQRVNRGNWQNFKDGAAMHLVRRLEDEAARHGYSPGAFRPFLGWFQADSKLIDPKTLNEAGFGLLTDNFLVEKNSAQYAVVIAEGDSKPLPDKFSDRVFQLSAAEFESALSQALKDEKRLLPFCVIICLAILTWAYRRFDRAVLAFIPAMGGLAAVLLFHWLFGRPIGLVEAAALPLVICLGSDYGIVVVNELSEDADLGAPKAIFVSGLSTIAGIGILVLASHPVLHALGKTTLVGLAAAMPISILILPKLWKSEKYALAMDRR